MVRKITLHFLLNTTESVRAEITRLQEAKTKLTDTGLRRITDWVIEGLKERLKELEK